MKKTELLKKRANALKNEVIMLYYAYQNPKTTLLPKLIILITVTYALSPIDLIPDFIPVFGYLDDLIIIPALIAISIKLISPEIIREAREKATKQTAKLKKRWFFAIIFIIIWTALLIAIVSAILHAMS